VWLDTAKKSSDILGPAELLQGIWMARCSWLQSPIGLQKRKTEIDCCTGLISLAPNR